MDLSAARREVKPATLLRYVAYARNGVRTAILNKVVLQANPILSKFTAKSQTLHTLSLLSGGSLQDSLGNALRRASKLRALTLSDKVVVTTATLAQCLDGCPTLEEVTCDALESCALEEAPVWTAPEYPRLSSWTIKVRPHPVTETLAETLV